MVLSIEPNFDFYRADRVSRLVIESSGSVRMVLDLAYEGPRQTYDLRLAFDGIRELVLPPMSPLMFLPELELEDVSASMLEGIRFEAVSQFERRFRCACLEISVLEFRPIGGEETREA